jgi:ADP-heptose:LPS heptosyltransferase
MTPVFIAAAGEDVSAFEGYRVVAGAPLGEVKELIAGASLFVGNDSGPAHMAAALGVPLAVVFGNSALEIWRPWKAVAEVLANREDIAAVGVDEMIEALGRLRVRA